jgi:hypothetical protein
MLKTKMISWRGWIAFDAFEYPTCMKRRGRIRAEYYVKSASELLSGKLFMGLLLLQISHFLAQLKITSSF